MRYDKKQQIPDSTQLPRRQLYTTLQSLLMLTCVAKRFFLLLTAQDPGSQFTKASQLMPVHHHHEVSITLQKGPCWDC